MNQLFGFDEPVETVRPLGRADFQSAVFSDTRVENPRSRKERFAPPTVLDILEYAKLAELPDYAEPFHDHFSSNGWKVGGKAPMQDWRAAYRNWHRRAPAFATKGAPASSSTITKLAEEYRDANRRSNDAAKRVVYQKAKAAGLEWKSVIAEIARLNERDYEEKFYTQENP